MLPDKFRAVLEQFLFASHVFILVLVLAENRLLIPDWLHVFGRLHPLLLHFPIVVLLLALLLLAFPRLLRSKGDAYLYGRSLLLIGCVTTSLTVVAGLLLSHEDGYEKEQLFWHKWSGLGVFWLSSLLYAYLKESFPVWQKAGLAIIGVSLLVSGHLGASITHGEGFITAPLTKEETLVALEDAEVFSHAVLPILEKKCIGCHKASKQKGELRLDQSGYITKGGESGPAIVRGDAVNSLLAQRIHLPLEDEKHMPPKGKPQLSEEETNILVAWINSGADFDKKLLSYSDTSAVFRLTVEKFDNVPKAYDFKPADPDVVRGLNNSYRKVQALGMGSPALSVSCFGRSVFNPTSLNELKGVQQQTVSLNLNNMPLTDKDMESLGDFPNLEKLYLNFADIRGEGIGHLQKLEKLKSLSLSGNPLEDRAVDQLANLKNLKQLFLWNTGLSEASVEKLRTVLPNTTIETGYRDDGTVYQLNPPVLKFDKAFFRDKLKVNIGHPIQGTSIFYTLDGSEPDSSNHILYNSPLEISSDLTLKARAFAPGWKGSESVSAEFIQSSKTPTGFFLKHQPADRYKGDGANSLFDGKKAVTDVWDLNWLGFRFTPLEVEMEFGEPTDIGSMALSIWYNSGSWLFPPEEVEIWTKPKKDADWTLAKKHRPAQPSKDDKNALTRIPIPFEAEGVAFMKFVAHPVASLPNWHGGKGQRAWIMVDELVMN